MRWKDECLVEYIVSHRLKIEREYWGDKHEAIKKRVEELEAKLKLITAMATEAVERAKKKERVKLAVFTKGGGVHVAEVDAAYWDDIIWQRTEILRLGDLHIRTDYIVMIEEQGRESD